MGGRSAVAAAAYRSASELSDFREGREHDYTDKRHVEHQEILLPEGAPEWMGDREQLWNAVQQAEVVKSGRYRKGAQFARELEVSLPQELSPEARLELAREYVRDQFVSRGMIADFVIHDKPGNPHMHVMLTLREVTPDGFGAKRRDWNAKPVLEQWREEWARYANRSLSREGFFERIDHRSLEAQKLPLEPQPKRWRAGDEVGDDRHALMDARLREISDVARRNGDRLAAHPEAVLQGLLNQQSAVSRTQLLGWIQRYTADDEQFAQVLGAVYASPALVELGTDPAGEEYYTSHAVLADERRLLEATDRLADTKAHALSARHVDDAIVRHGLSDEQAAMLRYLGEGRGLGIVQGRAGTGKSYAMNAYREAAEADGYRLVGAALSGKAAEGLEESSGIESHTIARLERQLERGQLQLDAKTVLVIDEAGMLPTRSLQRLATHAERSGASLVLVGDSAQLGPIEAGDAFRALYSRHSGALLSEVRRQEVDWQREASIAFAEGRGREALEAYAKRGRVREHASQQEAREAMVQRWARFRSDSPDQSSLLVAYRRADVAEINTLARDALTKRGELGQDCVLQDTQGQDRTYATGERVYFTRNDRGLGVKNGTLGTVERIEGNSLQVRLDGKDATVRVDLRQWDHLAPGYCATTYKAQGVTVDRSFVLGGSMDSAGAYVALSRHRKDCELHFSLEESPSRENLFRQMSRQKVDKLCFERADSHKPGVGDFHRLVRRYERTRDADCRAEIRAQVTAAASAQLSSAKLVQHTSQYRDAQARLDNALKRQQTAEEHLQRLANQKPPKNLTCLAYWVGRTAGARSELASAEQGVRNAERAVEQVQSDPAVHAQLEPLHERHARRQAAAERALGQLDAADAKDALRARGRDLAQQAGLRLATSVDEGREVRVQQVLRDGEVHVAVLQPEGGDRFALDITGHKNLINVKCHGGALLTVGNSGRYLTAWSAGRPTEPHPEHRAPSVLERRFFAADDAGRKRLFKNARAQVDAPVPNVAKVVRELPEAVQIREQLEVTRAQYKTANAERKQWERDHPLRAKMGSKRLDELTEAVRRTYERHTAAFERYQAVEHAAGALTDAPDGHAHTSDSLRSRAEAVVGRAESKRHSATLRLRTLEGLQRSEQARDHLGKQLRPLQERAQEPVRVVSPHEHIEHVRVRGFIKIPGLDGEQVPVAIVRDPAAQELLAVQLPPDAEKAPRGELGRLSGGRLDFPQRQKAREQALLRDARTREYGLEHDRGFHRSAFFRGR